MSKPTNERRMDERQRRALADEHRGEVVDGSGVQVEPRRLDQMVSVRLDPAVLRELRTIAVSRNTSLSAILRDAVVQYAAHADQLTELRWRLEGEVSTSESRASWRGPSFSASSLRSLAV
jgi:predicted transcriptional regulator